MASAKMNIAKRVAGKMESGAAFSMKARSAIKAHPYRAAGIGVAGAGLIGAQALSGRMSKNRNMNPRGHVTGISSGGLGRAFAHSAGGATYS